MVMAQCNGHRTSQGHSEAYKPMCHEPSCQSTAKHSDHDLSTGPHDRREDQGGQGASSSTAKCYQSSCCSSGVVINMLLPGKRRGSKEQSVTIHFGGQELVS